jgi:hypothetical protein
VAAALVALLMQISALLSCEFGSNAAGVETIGVLRRRSLDEPACHYYRPTGRFETIPRHGAFLGLSFSVLLFGFIALRCVDLLIAIVFAAAATCQSLTFLLFMSHNMYSLDSGAFFSLISALTMVVTAIVSVRANDKYDDDEDDDSDSTSSPSAEDDGPATIGVIGSDITFDAVAAREQQQPLEECPSPKARFVISEKTGRKILAAMGSPGCSTDLSLPATSILPLPSTAVYSKWVDAPVHCCSRLCTYTTENGQVIDDELFFDTV